MKLDIPVPVSLGTNWSPALSRAWTLGQLLDVTVIGPTDQNSTLLQVGGVTVAAAGQIPYGPGDSFTVRVTGVQSPVSLSIVPNAAPLPEVDVSSVQSAALRTLLPAQLDLSPALQALQSAAPSADTPAVDMLLRQLPTLAEIASAPKILAAVTQSGSGLEATLANQLSGGANTPPPLSDLKWQVLQLLQQLAPMKDGQPTTPPAIAPIVAPVPPASPADPIAESADRIAAAPAHLKALAEGILARITTRQIQTAEAAQQGQVYGQFEIPVRVAGHPDVLTLQYAREGPAQHEQDIAHHTLTVTVPLPNDAKLTARLTLHGENLSVVAWGSDAALNQQLQARREEFRTSLGASGFNIETLVIAPVEASRTQAFLPHGLINTQI